MDFENAGGLTILEKTSERDEYSNYHHTSGARRSIPITRPFRKTSRK
jgi:hypothetical protein